MRNSSLQLSSCSKDCGWKKGLLSVDGSLVQNWNTCLLIGNVVHEHASVSTAVESHTETLEALLAGGVPNLPHVTNKKNDLRASAVPGLPAW